MTVDIDAVIADYTPKAGTIDVHLPTGVKLSFNVFETRHDKKAWEKAAVEWWLKVQKPKKSGEANIHARVLGEYLPKDADDAVNAHMVHHLSVEPKISLTQACKMLYAPELMEHILAQIDAGNETMNFRLKKAVIDATKKPSDEMTSDDDSLEPVEPSGESIPTS